MLNFLKKLFSTNESLSAEDNSDNTMKYLIVGLGNIGPEYADNRHNIGFMIVDELAKQEGVKFSMSRHAYHTEFSYKGRNIHLIKPTTFMNLSGKALVHWMRELKVAQENVLVLVDDLAIPFGSIKIKPKGSSAGHNGLKNIEQLLGNSNYSRLRFGVSDNFPKGRQVDYVLSGFDRDELPYLQELIDRSIAMIKAFCTIGVELTMTNFNNWKVEK